MTTDLAKREENGTIEVTPAQTPAEQVKLATDIANHLSAIVEAKKLYEDIKGKKHLKAEAWQTVVAFNNAHPITEWCVPIRDGDGEIIAYEAKVNIVKDGEVIASGIMPYGLDEFACRGQSGFGKHRAAYSTAQTLAGAKAARTKYAWVVTLAGYSGTPAEEMPSESSPQQPAKSQPRRKSAAFCETHNAERTEGSGKRRYHMLGEFFCIVGEGLRNAAGEPVEELPEATDPSDNMAEFDTVVEGQATLIDEDDRDTMEAH